MDAHHSDLDRDDRVSYRTEDGREYEGTVCKANRGGVRVLPDGGGRLHVIKNGRLRSVHPDGGALRHRSSEGRVAELEVVGEGEVEYRQRAGWTHC